MLEEPILFITGAGASVDSGLNTYRGKNGLYTNTDVSPEENLSLNTWMVEPERTWETLSELINLIKTNQPGETYEILKQINEMYKIAIYTQNIDGYSHYACKNVHELHGHINTMYCKKCRNIYTMDHENPMCISCMIFCKPNIVLYGEPIRAIPANLKCAYKTIIVLGTTLQFQYLRNIIKKYKLKGAKIIHINPDPNYSKMIKKNEDWLQMNSAEGLIHLFEL